MLTFRNKMAFRSSVKGSDPFASKTTRNERFVQMSKQEQLIQQKKQEIQRRLEEQQKKDSDEALRKVHNVAGSKAAKAVGAGLGLGQHNRLIKAAHQPYWKSNDPKWKNDIAPKSNITGHGTQARDETKHVVPTANSSNLFSNDGSFLDQFKKLSGTKGLKVKKDEDIVTRSVEDSMPPSDSSRKLDNESDTTWSNRSGFPDKRSSSRDDRDRRSSHRDRDPTNVQPSRPSRWSLGDRDSWQRDGNSPSYTSSSRHYDSPPNRGPRPSSPYSPSRETPDVGPPTSREKIAVPPVPSKFTIHPPPSIAMTMSMTQSPFAHQVGLQPQTSLPYSAPPPPLHSIPPPLPIQPHSIPPPSPLQPHSIPPPPSQPNLKSINVPIHAPSTTTRPTLVQLPTNLPPPCLPNAMTSNIPPPMLHTLPILQHSAPPPPLHHSLPHFQLNTPPPTSSLPPLPPVVACIGSSLMQQQQQQQQQPHTMFVAAAATTGRLAPGAATVQSFETGVSSAALPPLDPVTEEATNHLARMVAQCGDDIEDIIKNRNPSDHSLWFLHNKSCAAYGQYRSLVQKFRSGNADIGAVVKQEQTNDSTSMPMKTNMDPFHAGSLGFLKQPPVCFVKQEPDVKLNQFCIVKQETDIGNPTFLGDGFPKRSCDDSDDTITHKKKRRSRWAPEVKDESPLLSPTAGPGAPAVTTPPQPHLAPITPGGSGGGPMISKVTRNDPALIQYAYQSFGSTNLSEEDWKKAEDHYKINLLYQDVLRKREELERLTRAGRFKYEYDSDEETDGGTWEHRLRSQEMVATKTWADELTEKAAGKHHIGDFLPPDELERFMEKYNALQAGREPDLSDYKEFKLKEDNIGFQMLQKLGWTEGQGLGTEGSGITDPVNKASNRTENQGLGLERPDDVSRGDDEFEAYRKRMMLAYRFRPNPLNNPRRSYY